MPGGYYVALSGLRQRLDQLDRLSEDLANSSTSGFKGERVGSADAPRPNFGDTLETAIDVQMGDRRLDFRQGQVLPTGRELDLAVQGNGFLAVQTKDGTRYTRNGHLTRMVDGTLTTTDGATVLGQDGPIKIEKGTVAIDDDGTIRNNGKPAGKLVIYEFDNPERLVREGGALLRPEDDTNVAKEVEDGSVVKGGALEQSNVSVIERLGELTDVARSFEALQKAISTIMNEVDGKSIDQLGRR